VAPLAQLADEIAKRQGHQSALPRAADREACGCEGSWNSRCGGTGRGLSALRGPQSGHSAFAEYLWCRGVDEERQWRCHKGAGALGAPLAVAGRPSLGSDQRLVGLEARQMFIVFLHRTARSERDDCAANAMAPCPAGPGAVRGVVR